MNRILVIDDDPEIKELVCKVLVRAGYPVRAAGTGEEGLALLAQGPAELLVIDKNLPSLHSAEVIAQARQRLPALAVILMTAYPEPFSIGAERLEGYLAKPFKSLKAIEDAVAQAFEAAAETQRRDELKSRLSQVMAGLSPGAKKRP